MTWHPETKRLAKVEFTPSEFIKCVQVVQATMQQAGTRDPKRRIELIGGFFGEEKGMAFIVRMECMFEMERSPKMKALSREHEKPGNVVMSQGLLHAAALAPLHYDDDSQYFDETEFFEIAELEQKSLITAGS